MTRTTTRVDAISRGAGHGDRDFGLREWIGRLPSGRGGPPLVTFDTRVSSMRHLPGRVGGQGGSPAWLPHCRSFTELYVDDVDGPMLDGELDRAAAWGRDLAALVEAKGPPARR